MAPSPALESSTPTVKQPTPESVSRGVSSNAAVPRGQAYRQKAARVPKSAAPSQDVSQSAQTDAVLPEAPPGKVYTGFRNERGQKEGFGVMRCKDGSIYNGQWKQDKRDGHGTLFFNGGVFEGQWLRGGAHGEGKVRFKNGDTFEGHYAENKKCGPGIYRWKDGSQEVGEYVDGSKHGWHKLTRGANKWDLLYENGGVVLARMSGAAVSSSDPTERNPVNTAGAITRAALQTPELATERALEQPSKSPRNTSVAAATTEARRSSQPRSKSPAVTLQPPYTRSSLQSNASEAKRSSVKAPSRSPRTSVSAVQGVHRKTLADEDMW